MGVLTVLTGSHKAIQIDKSGIVIVSDYCNSSLEFASKLHASECLYSTCNLLMDNFQIYHC